MDEYADMKGRPVEEGPIDSILNNQRDLITNVEERVTHLEQRLHSCLQPEMPAMAADQVRGLESTSHGELWHAINENNQRLKLLIDRVVTIRDRVEL